MEPEWHIENKNNNNNNMTFGISVETCLSWVKKGDVWSSIPTVYIYIYIYTHTHRIVYICISNLRFSDIFFNIVDITFYYMYIKVSATCYVEGQIVEAQTIHF